MNNTKVCSKCGRELPLEMFYKNKNSKDGFDTKCKDCYKKYYNINKARILQYHDKYREKYKNILKTKKLEYYNPQVNPKGWASRMISNYRQMDKERNFEFDEKLTVDWFLENIAYKPCAHCGKQGIGLIGCNRLDNSKGHTLDNIEPCCRSCNTAERNKEYK